MKKLILTLITILVMGIVLIPAVLADSPGQESTTENVQSKSMNISDEANLALEENLNQRNELCINRRNSEDREEFARRGGTEAHKLEKIEWLKEVDAITEEEADELIDLIEEKQSRKYGACLNESLDEVNINMRNRIHDSEDERFGAGFRRGRK